MNYLVDTCALSELIKPMPAPSVVEWFEAAPAATLFVSALALGEIRKGVERLPEGRRRTRIGTWLEVELPAWFEDRVLPVDRAVADEWGRLLAQPAPARPAIDALLAATALHHRLTIVTRNVADFAWSGVPVANPWETS